MADEGLSPGSFMPNCSASCVSMHCQHTGHASQHHMPCSVIPTMFSVSSPPLSWPSQVPRGFPPATDTPNKGQIPHDCTPALFNVPWSAVGQHLFPTRRYQFSEHRSGGQQCCWHMIGSLQDQQEWPATQCSCEDQQECPATQCSCEGRRSSPRLCALQSCPWVWGWLHRCQLPPHASTAPRTEVL